MNVWRFVIFLCMAFLISSPVGFSTWTMEGGDLSKINFPTGELPYRLAMNPTPSLIAEHECCIRKVDEGVSLTGCSAEQELVHWRSPADWDVKEAFFADLNLDQMPELVMLVWRPFRSWPVDEFMPHGGRIDSFQDNNGKSCQVILVGLRGNEFVELWAGSALAEPLHSLRAADFDGDGLDELAALEYSYDGNPYNASMVLWEWNGFGFSLVARQPGNYATLLIMQNDPPLLLTIE